MHVHEWERALTPPDGGYPWFRCTTCKVFGYRRHKTIKAYVCQLNGCHNLAIDRLRGRGPRAGFLWRCSDHLKP